MVTIGLHLLQQQIRALILQEVEEKLTNGLQSLDTVNWLSPLIEQQMSAVVIRFKERLPFVGLFLTEGMNDVIKDLGTEEILKAWPDIRISVQEHLMKKIDLKPNRKTLLYLKGFGALVGFCQGVVFLGLAFLITFTC